MEFTEAFKADSYVLSNVLRAAGKQWRTIGLVVCDGEHILWKTQIHPQELKDALTHEAALRGISEEINDDILAWVTARQHVGMPTVCIDANAGIIRVGHLSAHELVYSNGFME